MIGYDKYGRAAALLLCLGFTACATVDEVPRYVSPAPSPTHAQSKVTDPSIQRLPVRDVTPKPAAPAPGERTAVVLQASAPVAASVPAPSVAPTLGDALKDKVLASPWTIASPIHGAWVWANDNGFVAVFQPDGTVQWGPVATGVYQLASASSLLFALRTPNGQPVPMPAQAWKVEFFENATVLVMSQGGQAYLFKRQRQP